MKRILAGAIAILATLGCGARSELVVGDTDAPTGGGSGPGAGGFTTASSTGGGGSGGGGAPPIVDAPTCANAKDTSIYVVLAADFRTKLFRYDPTPNAFTFIGDLPCAGTNSPFSMAIDRAGHAYVEFQGTGEIVRVSAKDASCLDRFHAGGFVDFGMSFATNDDGQGETLYIAESGSNRLASVDVDAKQAHVIGTIKPDIGPAELSGPHDGTLHAFGLGATSGMGATQTHLATLDKTSGAVVDDHAMTIGLGADAFAFGSWGGKFYFFTSSSGAPSQVTAYDPVAGTEAVVAIGPGRIVGAGVSTCAPD